MSQFKVKTQTVKGVASDLGGYQTTLSSLRESVSQVRSSLNLQSSSSSQIKSSLKKVYDNLGTEAKTLGHMKQTLNRAAQEYENTEERILNAAEDGNVSLLEKTTGTVANITDTFWDKAWVMPGTVISSSAECIFTSSEGWEFSFLDGEKSIVDGDISDGDIVKGKSIQYGEDDADVDKVVSIVEAEWKKEGARKDKSGSIENEYGSAEGEVKVLSGEVHASAYGGICSVDENGKKRYTPGVGAEIGVGITALTASGKLSTGNDMLGAYVSGEVNVLKAEATAGFDVGLVDETGKLNPQLHASASAEALLFEASAAVGGTVLGADVSGNVGVSVGVGAHANVGIKDGVVTFDVGAALGVGVSVNFEVDLSGTVEKVGGVISDGVSALASLFD